MDSYADYLLEFIAWRMAAGNREFLDFRIWMRGEYASRLGCTEKILREMPARSDALGEVPADVGRKDVGVLIDPGDGATKARKKDWRLAKN